MNIGLGFDGATALRSMTSRRLQVAWGRLVAARNTCTHTYTYTSTEGSPPPGLAVIPFAPDVQVVELRVPGAVVWTETPLPASCRLLLGALHSSQEWPGRERAVGQALHRGHTVAHLRLQSRWREDSSAHNQRVTSCPCRWTHRISPSDLRLRVGTQGPQGAEPCLSLLSMCGCGVVESLERTASDTLAQRYVHECFSVGGA